MGRLSGPAIAARPHPARSRSARGGTGRGHARKQQRFISDCGGISWRVGVGTNSHRSAPRRPPPLGLGSPSVPGGPPSGRKMGGHRPRGETGVLPGAAGNQDCRRKPPGDRRVVIFGWDSTRGESGRRKRKIPRHTADRQQQVGRRTPGGSPKKAGVGGAIHAAKRRRLGKTIVQPAPAGPGPAKVRAAPGQIENAETSRG